MSVGFILSLLLLNQPPPPPSTLNDHGFRLAVESFIHDTGKVRDLDQVLPPVHAAMVRRLGCEHYECREAAERELADLGDAGWRAVAWGRWHKDAEIAIRCERLMGYLVCPACEGLDECPEKTSEMTWCSVCPWNSDTLKREYHCHTCKGARRLPRPERD